MENTKKFYYNKNISAEQNSVLSHLTRRCTLMEIARNSEEKRRSLSRTSSMDSIHQACTSTEKGSAADLSSQSMSKGKQNTPASSENAVTKKESSSPVLYKNDKCISATEEELVHDSGNAKSVCNSPFFASKIKRSDLLGDREAKLLSVSSDSLSPKRMSRCYYAIIVSIICLCLIGVMGVVSGLIYLNVFTENGKWNSISTMKSLLSGRYPASSGAQHFKMNKETDVEHGSKTQKENPSHFEPSVTLNKSNLNNKIIDIKFDNISVNLSDSSSVFIETPTNEITLHTILQVEDTAKQFPKISVLESSRRVRENENITSNIYGTEGFIRKDHILVSDQIIQKHIFNITSPNKAVKNSIHSSDATIHSAVKGMLQNDSEVFMKEKQAEKNQKHDFAQSESEQAILPTTTLKAKEIKYATLNKANTPATTPIISATSIKDELIAVAQFSSQSMNRDNLSLSTFNLDIPNLSSMSEHRESMFKSEERPNAFLKQTSTTVTTHLPKIPIDMKSSLAEALKHLQVLDNSSKLPTSRKKSIKLPKLSINSPSSENIKSKVQVVPKTTSSTNEFEITAQLETGKFNSIVTPDGVIIPIPIQYMTSTKLEESPTTKQPVITRSQMDIKSSLAEALKHLRMLPKGSKLPSPRVKSASLPKVPVLSPSIETFPEGKRAAANPLKSNRLRAEYGKPNINGVSESVTEHYSGISSHANFANKLKLELDELADVPSGVIFNQPKKPFGLISSLGDALKYMQNLDQLNRLRSTPRQKKFIKTEK
ncbi:uncharacterized protein LOC118203950 [Stegodyphus dumicola]|uniref:uncharacterized protein LOC118203950 n=1 Tax=Stegodyphus dumicola TaxID=202533 RepID=UPI0015ADD7B4|nr:uncharacterized protein LOC118203950 [Stegodyphus dumicola]